MEPIRIFSDSDSKLPLLLLYEDLPRFVVPGLPHADNSAVGLNLVDVSTWNPDLLRRIDRRRHDGSRSHDRGRDDARADDRVSQDAANNPSDEPGPEMTPAMTPAAVMMVVHWRGHRTVVHHRRRAVVHHRRRTMVHHGARPAEAAAMTAEARAGTGHKRSSRQNRAKYKYHLLVHFVFPFSAFAVTTR